MEVSEPQLASHNLLLCFLNETPSDLEDDSEDDKELRVPPNHPLACLGKREQEWDSSSSDDEESLEAVDQNISLERVNTSRVLVEGNISRKKGHVIIPLRCASEVHQDGPPSSASVTTTASGSNNDLENGFFQQLAVIQVTAICNYR